MYVTAWRVWRLLRRRGNNWFLTSPHRLATWEAPLMTACCEPGLADQHGLYSCGSQDRAWEYAAWCGANIIGEVRLLGKSVEHTEGWRAHQQLVLSLFLRAVKVPRSELRLLERLRFGRPLYLCGFMQRRDDLGEPPNGYDFDQGFNREIEYAFVNRPLSKNKLHGIARALSSRYEVDCEVIT